MNIHWCWRDDGRDVFFSSCSRGMFGRDVFTVQEAWIFGRDVFYSSNLPEEVQMEWRFGILSGGSFLGSSCVSEVYLVVSAPSRCPWLQLLSKIFLRVATMD